LSRGEAVEQSAQLIVELPNTHRPLLQAREIAVGLIDRLPKHDSAGTMQSIGGWERYRWRIIPKHLRFWVVYLALGAAALVIMILYGGFPFGGG